MGLFVDSRASTLSNAVSSLASTGMSFTKVDEREKQAALEEEQARLKALKVLPRIHFNRRCLIAKVHMHQEFILVVSSRCPHSFRIAIKI